MTITDQDISIDPMLAIREVAYAWHDFHDCDQGGVNCPDRARHGSPANYDAILPALFAVANVATQLSLTNMTHKLGLTDEAAAAKGIYSTVDWSALVPLLGCKETRELPEGTVVECVERGAHTAHTALWSGVAITWET